ncbi:MAG TPA: Fe-S cluster assembly protein SufD [Acidimicrobiales bacterium]|nr:Fe-S cluster assembly protein SufD [Acidimicrobiales bacterium]
MPETGTLPESFFPMNTFAESASTYIDGRPDAAARRQAWSVFESVGLPTTSDEVWRYAPLGDLRLERFHVPSTPESRPDSAFATQLCQRAGLVIRVVDGFCVSTGEVVEGVSVEIDEANESLAGGSLLERYESDTFALLNAALAPAATVIRVAANVNLAQPIVVLNESSAGASFPRTQIVVGRGASVTVVEYFEGGGDALVVPVSEYQVDDNASLQLITYQRLDASAWHVARTTGLLARDARLHQAVVGLGAHYDRSRNDAELLGAGASNELRTTFLGSGDQVHDFRTRQYHVAPRTTSTLLSKGAVADRSRSVYTGLIEIEKGAKRTDARQTNHNLLLSPLAHADSVPNLDIRENDVMCAHASSVGPLDELQRWYLESRGVSRDDAQRLLIQGFFFEMLSALPSELAELVESDIASVLANVAVVTS